MDRSVWLDHLEIIVTHHLSCIALDLLARNRI